MKALIYFSKLLFGVVDAIESDLFVFFIVVGLVSVVISSLAG